MAHSCPKILCLTCTKCRAIYVDDHFGRIECLCEYEGGHFDSVCVRGLCGHYEEEVDA